MSWILPRFRTAVRPCCGRAWVAFAPAPRTFWAAGLVLAVLLLLPSLAQAAKISELAETGWWEQARRFLSLRDPAVRYAVTGSIMLGISCGLLGSFIVVRRLALVGDTLSHAVLPGVALGFLWTLSKDPLAIFVGAVIAGLAGTVMVQWIRESTHLKEDSALGMVLAGFYALGITLFTMIQNLPVANKGGLDRFLFGQAAALGRDDVLLITAVTLLASLLILIFYKELLATSFDPGFARAIGMPARLFHYLVMLLLAFAIVVALQAVGVVLVSAMLITPAASAYLLTDRMHRMLLLAGGFGAGAGLLGAFVSFLGSNLPTGPFMVLAATLLFVVAFLAAPRHGLVPRWLRNRSRDGRIQVENTLKSAYHVQERQPEGPGVAYRISLSELAEVRNESLPEAEGKARMLVRRGLASWCAPGEVPQTGVMTGERAFVLTPEGWRRACQMVRNHRLWELYLTNAADYPADHVHEDAEVIEHILGEELVRGLERRLNYPAVDPHGRLIPGEEDMRRHGAPVPTAGGTARSRAEGY